MAGHVPADQGHRVLVLAVGAGRALPPKGRVVDQGFHVVHRFHPVAVEFQRVRLPEHIPDPLLPRPGRGEEHPHEVLVKIPQGGAVQPVVGGQLIQQLAGLLLHGEGVALLQQAAPAGDLRDVEGLGPTPAGAGVDAAFQGYVLALFLQQGLPHLSGFGEGFRPRQVKGGAQVQVLAAGALQVGQLPRQQVPLEGFALPALQDDGEGLLLRHDHRRREHLQRGEHLAADVVHRQAQHRRVPGGAPVLPAQRLHQGQPGRLPPQGDQPQLFKGGQVALGGRPHQKVPQQPPDQRLFLLVKQRPAAGQLLAGPLGPHLPQGLFHRFDHLGVGGRLHDVVKAAQPHRLLGVLELGVGGQEDAPGPHPLAPHPFQQVEAALHRHLDVAQHHLGLPPLQAGPGVDGVQSALHLVKAQRGPVGAVQQPLHHAALVVHDQQFHCASSFSFAALASLAAGPSSSGRNISTRAPPPLRLAKATAACGP